MDALRSRVLVTGARGFIGRHVVRRLVAAGAEVHALSRTAVTDGVPRHEGGSDQIAVHQGDLNDPASIAEVVERVDPHRAIHLGGFTHVGRSWEQVDECIQTNVQGTVHLLGALGASECHRVVHVSTSDVYGDIPAPFAEHDPVNPVSPYAVSKYSAERFCLLHHQAYGTPVVIVRPFNAYGPGQSADRVVPEIISCALRGADLCMTEARQTREFNHVDDIASGIVAAATVDGIEGEIFNLGCGDDISIRDVTEMILELMGGPIVARFGAVPERPNEIRRMAADASKAREQLGWRPHHDLRDGLAETIEWYRRAVE